LKNKNKRRVNTATDSHTGTHPSEAHQTCTTPPRGRWAKVGGRGRGWHCLLLCFFMISTDFSQVSKAKGSLQIVVKLRRKNLHILKKEKFLMNIFKSSNLILQNFIYYVKCD